MQAGTGTDAAPQPSPPGPLLLAAFRASNWLHWLWHGAADAVAGVLGQAAARPHLHSYGSKGTVPVTPAPARTIDVHSLNRAQARSAVLHALHAHADAAAKRGNGLEVSEQPRDEDGLTVIVGKGLNSRVSRTGGHNALRQAISELCRELQVTVEDVPDNPGRLRIPQAQVQAYARLQWQAGRQRSLMSRMALRFGALAIFAACVLQLGSAGLFDRLRLPSGTSWPDQ